jgi:hypothetical protein
MPKIIKLDEIFSILECGDFNQLIGGLEDEHLECKREPYRLKIISEKMELAKDISALANADGGIILIGVTTKKDPTLTTGDVIQRYGCFAENLVEFKQYEDVIGEWVIPSVPGLNFKWHPSITNPQEGIVSIRIPQTACQERPFVVGKVITADTENVSGSHLGYFERRRDRVPPMKASELRERLKDGLRFAELNARLMNVEEMVGKAAARDQPPPHPTGPLKMIPALVAEEVLKRVERAREVVGFQSRPTFSLLAWPDVPIDFPGLFESREDAIVQLLEHPPQLRNGGFDLLAGRLSTIVEGKLRRCTAPGYRLLEVWRDGPLIGVWQGDGGHLCWGMDSPPEAGLRINNLALTETVFLFCYWALKMYKFAALEPGRLRFRMMFSDMAPTRKPFSLNPHPISTIAFKFYDDGQPAPESAGKHFDIQTDFANAEAGTVAYKLLFDLYTWFGFEANRVPYVNRDKEPMIDPALILSSATRHGF